MCFYKSYFAVFDGPQIPPKRFLYLFLTILGSGRWTDPSRHDSNSDTDPANGGDGKGSYSNSPCSAAR